MQSEPKYRSLCLLVMHVASVLSVLVLASCVAQVECKKLLFVHLPGTLAYYDAYMTELRTTCEVIRLPKCKIQDVEKAIILHQLGPDDVVFFNQMCSNHFPHNTTTVINKLLSVNCRIAFLNKEYADLNEKIEYIKSLNATVVLTHHHAIAELKRMLHGVLVARVPFAATPAFSQHATQSTKALPYLRDIGHSGNSKFYDNTTSNNHSQIMSWRQSFHQLETSGAFSDAGVNVATLSITKHVDQYIRNMAESKMWFSTTSQGDLLPQRTFEVLASGRALLLMNRPTDRRITDGILYEGEHCAMFNTSAELVQKAQYYATHEAERLKIVAKALQHARANHFWKNRADTIKFLIDDMNCGI